MQYRAKKNTFLPRDAMLARY